MKIFVSTHKPDIVYESTYRTALFKKKLVNFASVSTRIVVTEHSNLFDFEINETAANPTSIEKVYKSVQLSRYQKLKLKMAVYLSNTKPKELSLCVFDPHHSITFYNESVILGSVDLCFECINAKINGLNASASSSLVQNLELFINDIGLHSQADWAALAKQKN